MIPQRFLTSFILFIIIMILLGLPFTHWGFLHDDFGVILHASTKNMYNFFTLFRESGMSTVVQPDNFITPEQSFFATLYRPLSYMFYAIQYAFFSLNPHGYFLIMIALHALNSVLFFNILTHFFSLTASLLGALLFAFHISYWDWMGWVAGQMHVLNFTLILLIILLVKKYVDRQDSWILNQPFDFAQDRVQDDKTRKFGLLFYLLALILFTISLFTRETAIILPLWIPLALMFYKPEQSWYTRLKITSGFFFCSLLYLGARIAAHPIKTTGGDIKVTLNPIDFIVNLRHRFFDLVTFGADVANLSWMPGGNRLLKGTLIALFFSLLVWLFYKSSQKKILAFCLLSMAMFMWPAILRYYSSRYLYKALPFLIIFILVGVLFYKHNVQASRIRFTRIWFGFLSLLIGFNVIALPLHFKQREQYLHAISQAFDKLADNSVITNRALCFIALPYYTFPTGIVQALRMRRIPHTQKIYYDTSTFAWGNKPITKNCITIRKQEHMLFIESHDPNVWFIPFNKLTSMGTITPHVVDKQTGKALGLMYEFDQSWIIQDLLFIMWDYERNQFIVL